MTKAEARAARAWRSSIFSHLKEAWDGAAPSAAPADDETSARRPFSLLGLRPVALDRYEALVAAIGQGRTWMDDGEPLPQESFGATLALYCTHSSEPDYAVLNVLTRVGDVLLERSLSSKG